jgi:hypothetical protein
LKPPDSATVSRFECFRRMQIRWTSATT